MKQDSQVNESLDRDTKVPGVRDTFQNAIYDFQILSGTRDIGDPASRASFLSI